MNVENKFLLRFYLILTPMKISKNSTWIAHNKSEFYRRRMISRISRTRQWGLPSENANGNVLTL
jgi:hypothetical protein